MYEILVVLLFQQNQEKSNMLFVTARLHNKVFHREMITGGITE